MAEGKGRSPGLVDEPSTYTGERRARACSRIRAKIRAGGEATANELSLLTKREQAWIRDGGYERWRERYLRPGEGGRPPAFVAGQFVRWRDPEKGAAPPVKKQVELIKEDFAPAIAEHDYVLAEQPNLMHKAGLVSAQMKLIKHARTPGEIERALDKIAKLTGNYETRITVSSEEIPKEERQRVVMRDMDRLEASYQDELKELEVIKILPSPDLEKVESGEGA